MVLISWRGSKFFFAQSSQKGQPVSGEKCQCDDLAQMRVELGLGLFGSKRGVMRT